jgi:hypothetical protein
MPTIARLGPYRVFSFSSKGMEPPHVHVQRERSLAKFWLQPITLALATDCSARELRQLERLVTETSEVGRRRGMSSSVIELRSKARGVSVGDDELTVLLVDGRKISVPLAWFPRLLHATVEQRLNFELLGEGEGIHWPDIDEDLSVAGLLRGSL